MSPQWTAYDSVPRRRARALARLARPVLTPAFYPTVGVTSAYWWDGHPNFGDALTPWLFERYGRIAVHTDPRAARVAGVGSILEQLTPEFSGTVWGSGLLYGEPCDLPQARYAAVRGHLTRRLQGIEHSVALGDPGLLVSRHVSRPPERWTLALGPHGMHHEHPDVQRFANHHSAEVRLIDAGGSVDSVVREIASCAVVASSSLHGLVVADSFGIPATWFGLEPELWGGSFKFQDYESVVTPGRTRRATFHAESSLSAVIANAALADAECVTASIDELEESLEQVEAQHLPPFLALCARRKG